MFQLFLFQFRKLLKAKVNSRKAMKKAWTLAKLQNCHYIVFNKVTEGMVQRSTTGKYDAYVSGAGDIVVRFVDVEKGMRSFQLDNLILAK